MIRMWFVLSLVLMVYGLVSGAANTPTPLKSAVNVQIVTPIFNGISNEEQPKFSPQQYTESIFLPVAPKNFHPDKTHETLVAAKPFNILDFSSYITPPAASLKKFLPPNAQAWSVGNLNIDTEVFLKNKEKDNNDSNYFGNLRNYFDNDFYDHSNAFKFDEDDEHYKQKESLRNDDEEDEEYDDEEEEGGGGGGEEYDEDEEEDEEEDDVTTTKKPNRAPLPKRVKYINVVSTTTTTEVPQITVTTRKRPNNVVQRNLKQLRQQQQQQQQLQQQHEDESENLTPIVDDNIEYQHVRQPYVEHKLPKQQPPNISTRLPVTRPKFILPRYYKEKTTPTPIEDEPTTTAKPYYRLPTPKNPPRKYFEPIHVTTVAPPPPPPKKNLLSKKKKYQPSPVENTGPVKFLQSAKLVHNDEIEVLNEELIQKLIQTTTTAPAPHFFPPPNFDYSSPKPFTPYTSQKSGQLFQQTSESRYRAPGAAQSDKLVWSHFGNQQFLPSYLPQPSYSLITSYKRKRDLDPQNKTTAGTMGR